MHDDAFGLDVPREPHVEDNAAYHETDEDCDLQPQSRHHYILANLNRIRIHTRRQATPGRLDVEAQDVGEDEEARAPQRRDGGERGLPHGEHDAGVDHVEGCGEEDGGEQDEEGLEEVEG